MSNDDSPTREKLMSSAIIVLAGSILITGGSLNRQWDVALFVMFVGCALGLIGLWGWFRG